jgi:hypothetical protein
MQITQQKTAKIMKKIFKKKFISDLSNLIFSGYENFFRPYYLQLCILEKLSHSKKLNPTPKGKISVSGGGREKRLFLIIVSVLGHS